MNRSLPSKRHPPRDLAEIDAELKMISARRAACNSQGCQPSLLPISPRDIVQLGGFGNYAE